MKDKLKILEEKKAQALVGGGQQRIDAQHAKGKLTARDRIHFLMDEGSFEEVGMLVTHRSTNFGLDKQKNSLLKCVTRIASPSTTTKRYKHN